MRDSPPTSDVVHVIPLNDLQEHSADLGAPCTCRPMLKEVDGGLVVVHNSWDGREVLEKALDSIVLN